MPRSATVDPVEALLDTVLPARWPADLAVELTAAWRKAVRANWTRDDPEDAPRVTELPPQAWQRTTAAGAEPIAPSRPRRRSSA